MREKFAALAHRQWSGWMEYLFSKGQFNSDGTWTMPKGVVERWQRQMNTEFDDLPDIEKETDFVEADKILTVVQETMAAKVVEILERLFERFSPPFLPEGFVELRRLGQYDVPALSVRIGDRDVTILGDGEILGSGTAVGEGREWSVSRMTGVADGSKDAG